MSGRDPRDNSPNRGAVGAAPSVVSVAPGTIPSDLRTRRQWVAWRWERTADGRWTKIPINARSGAKASATAPVTWGSFDAALAYAEGHGLPGVGFVFSPVDAFTGIDLDGCRHPDSGALTAEATAIVAALDSYTEVSPSGCGVHVIVEGAIPGERSRLGRVEMYDAGRYFTMTGHRLPGTPATVEPRQAALDTFYRQTFGANGRHDPSPVTAGAARLSDDEVIAKARSAANGPKFVALWFGDTSGHGADDSATDLALLSLLSFWTQDPDQLDRLFRRSGLMREKWERADYRARTIAKALDRSETYETAGGWTRLRRGSRSRARFVEFVNGQAVAR